MLFRSEKTILSIELKHYPVPEEKLQNQFIFEFLEGLPFEKLKQLVGFNEDKKPNGDIEFRSEIYI